MRRTKIGFCILAAVAILAVSTTLAVTQLYVDSYFKYRGHWVFNNDTGAAVTVRVQNNTMTTRGVVIEYSARLVDPIPAIPPATTPTYTIGATVFGSLNGGQTKDFDFTLPAPVTSLNFLRIRRFP